MSSDDSDIPREIERNPKLYTQADLDAAVAAAYEDCRSELERRAGSFTDTETNVASWNQAQALTDAMIWAAKRTPADALRAQQEHDAALREHAIMAERTRIYEDPGTVLMGCSLSDIQRALNWCAQNDVKHILEGYRKLEAYNAALREQIANAKRIREDEIKTALGIMIENRPGAALNAVTEDFPWLKVQIASAEVKGRTAAIEAVCDAIKIEPVYPGAERKGLRICGFAIKGKNQRTGAKVVTRAERLKAKIRELADPKKQKAEEKA